MRRPDSLTVLILSVALLASCHNATLPRKMAPGDVAQKFFHALNNRDYQTARDLGTDQTDKIVSFIENLSSLGGGGKVIINDSKSELLQCTVNGKEAVCVYKKFDGGTEKVFLLKQKNRWLVDLRKEE